MTISTTISTISYNGDGTSVTFSIPWLWYSNADITVEKITGSTGVVSTLVLDTDYTLSGAGAGSGSATLTVAPLDGSPPDIVTIFLNPPLTQLSHYVDNAEFPSATLEEDFDRNVQIAQRLQDQITRSMRAPDADDSPSMTLPVAASRADKYVYFDANGDVGVSDGTTTDASLRADLAAGASALVKNTGLDYPQTDAEAAASVTILELYKPYGYVSRYCVCDGVTDDSVNLQKADTACAAMGIDLVFDTGTCLVNSATTFASRVWMHGGTIKTTITGAYLKFSAGFKSELYYCLNTDQPTQFISIPAIYPQWFGLCGLTSQDSSIPMERAFRACRAGMNGVSATTDASFGCIHVHFIRGNYRCNNVDVYCQTIITGEVTGAINGSYITQIDRTLPALRIHAKNYSLTNTVLNDSNGINTILRCTFRAEQISDGNTNEFVVRFYSPTESISILGIPGDDAGGNVGHIDTTFERCWFQFTPNHPIGVQDGKLSFWVKDCTFDVTRGGVHFAGTSYGGVKFQEVQGFELVRGLVRVDTSSSNSVDVVINVAEIGGAGNCQNSEATYRRIIYYNPSGSTAGKVHIADARITSVNDSGNLFGGPIYVRNAARFTFRDSSMEDMDSADFEKFCSIGATEVYVSDVLFKSNTLASYTTSRIFAFAGAAPTICQLDNISIYNTNASAIATGIQSNAAISGGTFFVKFYGNFTANYDASTIYSTGLRNSIKGLTNEKPGSAAPTTGTWVVGDRVINNAPSVGNPKAWVCTASGTPGTWVSEGNL